MSYQFISTIQLAILSLDAYQASSGTKIGAERLSQVSDEVRRVFGILNGMVDHSYAASVEARGALEEAQLAIKAAEALEFSDAAGQALVESEIRFRREGFEEQLRVVEEKVRYAIYSQEDAQKYLREAGFEIDPEPARQVAEAARQAAEKAVTLATEARVPLGEAYEAHTKAEAVLEAARANLVEAERAHEAVYGLASLHIPGAITDNIDFECSREAVEKQRSIVRDSEFPEVDSEHALDVATLRACAVRSAALIAKAEQKYRAAQLKATITANEAQRALKVVEEQRRIFSDLAWQPGQGVSYKQWTEQWKEKWVEQQAAVHETGQAYQKIHWVADYDEGTVRLTHEAFTGHCSYAQDLAAHLEAEIVRRDAERAQRLAGKAHTARADSENEGPAPDSSPLQASPGTHTVHIPPPPPPRPPNW